MPLRGLIAIVALAAVAFGGAFVIARALREPPPAVAGETLETVDVSGRSAQVASVARAGKVPKLRPTPTPKPKPTAVPDSGGSTGDGGLNGTGDTGTGDTGAGDTGTGNTGTGNTGTGDTGGSTGDGDGGGTSGD